VRFDCPATRVECKMHSRGIKRDTIFSVVRFWQGKENLDT
jgi:hypothetical protein